MASTTIRVDTETHASLVAMSRAMGASLIDTVKAAAAALQRQRFGADVVAQLSVLKSDPVAWAEYVAESDLTEVADGLD